MKSTKWKCRFVMDGVLYERRIYEDSDGDLFIRHNRRFYEYESFFHNKYVSRWRDKV